MCTHLIPIKQIPTLHPLKPHYTPHTPPLPLAQIGDLTTEVATQCLCTHLTSFGGDFVVPPNTIDFSTVFSLEKFLESMPVFITVILVLMIYVGTMVWGRREDKKDLVKVGVRRVYVDCTSIVRQLYDGYTVSVHHSDTSACDLRGHHGVGLQGGQLYVGCTRDVWQLYGIYTAIIRRLYGN